jgi:hypothetical protein
VNVDDVRAVALVLHVAAGVFAILIAAKVMARGARQDWSTLWGIAYAGGVIVVVVSAIVLASAGSTLPATVRWILVVVAVATGAAAVRGLQLARRRVTGSPSSRPTQLRLSWASLTSLVAAIAIVSAPVAVWVPVLVAGIVLTHVGHHRASRDPAWAQRLLTNVTARAGRCSNGVSGYRTTRHSLQVSSAWLCARR